MPHTPGPWKGLALTVFTSRDGDSTIEFDNPDDAPLVLAAPDLLAMLERLEWSVRRVRFEFVGGAVNYQACPICDNDQADGHAEDCELAALIKRARGEV